MPKFCMSGADYYWEGNWLETTDNFEIPSGQVMNLRSDSLTYDFVLNEEHGTHCYMQFF